jgi:hypothetical protein
MEPTPSSAQPPAPGQPLVEYVRTNRQNAAIGLAGLAVLLLAATVFLALKGFRTPPTPEKPADKPAPTNPLDPDEPPELSKTPETPAQVQNQYHLGWIGCLMAFLVAATAAAWLLAGPPPVGDTKQRTEARVLILAVGGLLGVLLVLYGGLYFYTWRESLTAWLSRGEVRESKWVLIPVLMMVLGAGLVFLAVQPARAEERNNPRLRRLVYGSNFGLTVLLLLIVLAVTNVVFAMRVPNELDTTASGFYSLSDETRDLVKRLDPPVTIYAVLPEAQRVGRGIGDVRQLLLACEDASAGKIKVKFVNSVGNARELADLAGRYPQLELTLADRRAGTAGAVVLTVAPDEKRHKVIPVPELFAGRNNFVGESVLFKELTLLADNQVKPVVYFTQSHGELSISPGGQVPPEENGGRLRDYLEKNYLDVRPLDLSGVKPAVPDDAAVVVVAGPRQPFAGPAVDALRAYATTARADGKKGKLLVLTGTVPGPGGKGVQKTGLEGLLGELNVRLGDRFLYTPPTEQHEEPVVIPATFTQEARVTRHPVATAISKAVNTIQMPFAREVAALNANPALRGMALLASNSPTWLEEDPIRQAQFNNVLLELAQKDTVRAAKQFRQSARPLGVLVTEGTTARAAVFGCAEFASDLAAEGLSPESAPITFDLIGVTIDWLRERPSVASVEIKAKQYQEYKFPEPSAVSATRLVYLPLALGLLAVVGLGVGVWVVRRK